MTRKWGPWTEVKLDALSNYLNAFASASQRARGTLYLDLFAGVPENTARRDGRTILGSPERALMTTPPLSKLVFCELQERSAERLRSRLAARYPGRDVTVLAGDCNQTLPQILRDLDRGWRYAPTFAFVDQFAAEIHWETIRLLAGFKSPGKPKVELWMYLGDALIPRAAYGPEGDPVFPDFLDRVDRMYGGPEWRDIRRAKSLGLLEPEQQRDELVNLMRWRLERDLGYRTTLPLSVHNESGAPIYTMIFATDHPAGDRIMKSVLGNAERELAEMRRRALLRRRDEREEEAGIPSLFTAASLYTAGETEVREPSLGPEFGQIA